MNSATTIVARALSRPRLREEFIDRSVALTEALDPAAVLVRDRHPQIAHRRSWRELHMTMTLADAAADADYRQRIAGVRVRVAHPAAVDDQRVVEQRAVAIGRGLQFVDKLREQRGVIGIDLHVLRDLL